MILSVAPMMDWTDNHYRTLARLISKHAWLYTEMVAAETIVHQTENLVRDASFLIYQRRLYVSKQVSTKYTNYF